MESGPRDYTSDFEESSMSFGEMQKSDQKSNDPKLNQEAFKDF